MMKKFGLLVGAALFLVACSEPATGEKVEAPAASASTAAATVAQQLNIIRAEAGLGAVKRNKLLDQAALAQARDMKANNFMGHMGTDGSDLRKRVDRTGYRWCMLAENVSRGYRTDARAVEGWRVSPGHYRNMVKTKAREFGMANVDGFRVMVLAARRC